MNNEGSVLVGKCPACDTQYGIIVNDIRWIGNISRMMSCIFCGHSLLLERNDKLSPGPQQSA